MGTFSLFSAKKVSSFPMTISADCLRTPEGCQRIRDAIREELKTDQPDFFERNGFRTVIDFDESRTNAEISIVRGDATTNQNPADWLIPKENEYYNAKPGFFTACDNEFLAGSETVSTMASNNAIYRSDSKNAYSIADGDPKSSLHLLGLYVGEYKTIMDKNFTPDKWAEMFSTLLDIMDKKAHGQQLRFHANSGLGFQSSAVLHVHAQAFDSFITPKPMISPKDYGLDIDRNGCVYIHDENDNHILKIVMEMIHQRTEISKYPAEINKNSIHDFDFTSLKTQLNRTKIIYNYIILQLLNDHKKGSEYLKIPFFISNFPASDNISRVLQTDALTKTISDQIATLSSFMHTIGYYKWVFKTSFFDQLIKSIVSSKIEYSKSIFGL